MFSTEQILLFFIALVTGDFLGMFIFEIAGIGAFLCILAILWDIMKVTDRGHCYQRVRDAEYEYNRLMASIVTVSFILSPTPPFTH